MTTDQEMLGEEEHDETTANGVRSEEGRSGYSIPPRSDESSPCTNKFKHTKTKVTGYSYIEASCHEK